MKTFFLLLLGAFTAWVIIGLIMGNLNFDTFFILVIGIIVGYQFGKRENKSK